MQQSDFLFYFLWVHHQKPPPFNKPAFLQTEDTNLSESLPSRRQNWRIQTIVTHYSRGPLCINTSFYKTCYSNPVMQLYFVFILLSSRRNKNTCLPVFCNHRLLQFAQYIFIVGQSTPSNILVPETPSWTFIGHRVVFFLYNRGSITF